MAQVEALSYHHLMFIEPVCVCDRAPLGSGSAESSDYITSLCQQIYSADYVMSANTYLCWYTCEDFIEIMYNTSHKLTIMLTYIYKLHPKPCFNLQTVL